jgi:ubiquitin carboxyl-terminal hydrolase 8
MEVYKELKSNIISDQNFPKVKNFVIDHSKPTNPFDFKHNGFIDPHQLKLLIDKYGEELLLIDFRSRDEFKKNHIRSNNVICIEPISIRQGYKDDDVELALVTSPDEERGLFSQRDEFEMVIIYDIGSKDIIDKPITKIYKTLHQRSFAKPLKRDPVILRGGIISWVETYGLSNFGHHHGDLSLPGKLIPRRQNQSESPSSVVRNFTEYLSNPTKTDFHSTPSLVSYAPPSQQQPIKRSNSFKLPKFATSSRSTTALPTPSPIPSRMLAQPHERVSSPQPALVSHSKADGNMHGHIDVTQLNVTTGLNNLGNSCYMNCIIQCLFGTATLFKLFLDGTWKSHVNVNSKLGTRGIMASYFAQLAQSLYSNDNGVFEPTRFKSVIGSLNLSFRNCDQQDCAEFLNFVLDGLHEDLNECGNRPREPAPTEQQEKKLEQMSIRVASTIEWERYLKSDFSAILYFFQGQFASQLKCLECGTTSTTYQSFAVLSLPIPEKYIDAKLDKIPLERCFEEFTKLEVLDGDNRWHCSKCKELRKSTKKITITRLPQNLIIHLKRFRSGTSYQKIAKFIDYPFEMNLTKFWPQVSSQEEAIQLAKLVTREQSPPFKYSLYAVANHSGSLSSGHYTAFVLKGRVKKWCYFDDTKVLKNVQKASVVNSNAYVLFYARNY